LVRNPQSFFQKEDRIDCAGIINVIRSQTRGIGGPARLGIEHLPEKRALPGAGREDAPFVQILVPNDRRRVVPSGLFRVLGRMKWVRRNMTGATSDSYAIRPH